MSEYNSLKIVRQFFVLVCETGAKGDTQCYPTADEQNPIRIPRERNK